MSHRSHQIEDVPPIFTCAFSWLVTAMCFIVSGILHCVKNLLCPPDALDEDEEAQVRAMPGIVMATDYSRPEYPRGWRPPQAPIPSTTRSHAYSTRSNLSDPPGPRALVRFPNRCPAGEVAVQRIQDQRLRQQRHDLMLPYDTHYAFREPPPSSTSSASTPPYYGNPNYTAELAIRRAQVGKPRINTADVPHAPPPGQRRSTVWNPYTSFNEPYVGDWRDEPFRTARNLGYKPPDLRERAYSFIDDLANMKVWMLGTEERERREQRDKRLAEALKIPPPRDPRLLPKRPLAMPGAFPTLQGHWYGKRRPKLPDGVRWRAGGSLPAMRPQIGAYGSGFTEQTRVRSVGPNMWI